MDNEPLAAPGFQEERFKVAQLTLAARRWGSPKGMPVLALHGWLDNCASFNLLAKRLGDAVDLVALDLAGHGLSDHRGHLGAYNIWQDLADILAVADQLEWSRFHLLGHSRGAMIAFLCAGTFPERVQSLAMIEGICPLLAEDHLAPEILAKSIEFLLTADKRRTHYYSQFDDAVRARVKGFIPVSEAAARAFAERGVGQREQGYFWHYDPKLLVGSELRLNQAQVDAFARRLPSTNKLLVVGRSGTLKAQEALWSWLTSVSALRVAELEGDHYLHMRDDLDNLVSLLNKNFY